MDTRNKRFLAAFFALVAIAVIIIVFGNRADAAQGDEPCVPADAWTETIVHPAVTHVVHHDAVTHVVHHDAVTHVAHHDAVTHEETVVDQEATPEVWADFSPDKKQGPFTGPPSYPTDSRGEWHVHDKIPGGHEGADGVYSQSDSQGRSSWFYRHAATKEVSHVVVIVDQEAYDETVVDSEAYDETVVDSEAYDETVVDAEEWTEVIEHPAVTCEGEQPDPLVETASSSSYTCGDAFETVSTTTTTTEYILVDGEWVLGEPVSETVETQNPVDVVACEEDPTDPQDPEDPTDPQEPNVPVTHHNPAPKNPPAVPTVVDAGL